MRVLRSKRVCCGLLVESLEAGVGEAMMVMVPTAVLKRLRETIVSETLGEASGRESRCL